MGSCMKRSTRPTKIRWSPPSCTAWVAQSNTANAWEKIGAPLSQVSKARPCHLSVTAWAKTCEMSCWSSRKTLIAKLPAADQRKARNIADRLAQEQLAAGDAKNATDGCTAKLDALGKDIAVIRAQLDQLVGRGAGAGEVAPVATPDASVESPTPVVDGGP